VAKERVALLAFNRGEVSKHALSRVDVERLRLSAETQENFLPYVLGPMMLRPGMEYIGGVNDNLRVHLAPFIFSNDDTALIEFTASVARVWVVDGDDEELVTREAVDTVVTNGDFSSDVGWTETETGAGATVTIAGGKLTMESPVAGGLAQIKRSVSVSGDDEDTEHAFRIVVDRGPVIFRCGTADGTDNVVTETTLGTGTHSIAFTPGTSTIYIQFETRTAQQKIVDSITIEAAGVMELPTPYTVDDLKLLRYSGSGDIVFIACEGLQQRKIERRALRSWSIVLYQADDGPFTSANLTDTTITPGALSGNTTLTASRGVFRSTHVGALFRLFSSGQTEEASLAAENTYTDAIRVTGVGDDARRFSITITGTWTGTLTLQRSFDSATSGFVDVSETWTANVDTTHTDDFDNSIVWYRVGFNTGDYGSDTAVVALAFPGGGDAGIARVVGFTSRTEVDVEVLTPFSSLTATTNWAEGDWSDRLGWPSSVAFHDGRLWWAGRDKIWGSVSDSYDSHNIDYEGDAGPINRSVGFGPVDTINWLMSLTRLIVGREGSETSIRSSSLDEPLTPTNFSLKDCSTQGSAAVQAVRVDTRGIFVQQSRRRAYELGYDPESQDYSASDLTRLNMEIGEEELLEVDVQRQPDTIVYFVRGDGQVACLLYEKRDQVEAWWRIVTDGEIESCAVLPGTLEDKVYFIVKRTINGSTVRYLEKMARRDECDGLPEGRLADSHLMYSGAATTTITGLDHLEGESVVVWGWNTSSPFTVTLPDGTSQTVGKDLGTFTVSGGSISGLGSSVTDACVGLTYSGKFKSAKLAYAAQRGTPLLQDKRVDQVGLILLDTHHDGIEYGGDFTTMDSLPDVVEGVEVNDHVIWEDYEIPMTTLPGRWGGDARLCLRATAPRPCTVAAAVIQVTTNG
jgi:hypothetical protein